MCQHVYKPHFFTFIPNNNRGDNVTFDICLSVCEQENSNSCRQISMKISALNAQMWDKTIKF